MLGTHTQATPVAIPTVQTFRTEAEVLQALGSPASLEDAIDAVLGFWANQILEDDLGNPLHTDANGDPIPGRPFSSGEVTACLRLCRPDIRSFNSDVGEYIRNAYSNGTLPLFGNTEAPIQVERTTCGVSRTPAGTPVFVYAPEASLADSWDFEIYVPTPGDDSVQNTPSGPALQPNAPSANPTPSPATVAQGTMVPGDVIATIHPDGRLCIPRAAFEAFAYESGKPITGGVDLYIAYCGPNEDTVEVTPDNLPGTIPVAPTKDRVRLHLTLPKPQPVGTRFLVGISRDQLTVDMSNPLP